MQKTKDTRRITAYSKGDDRYKYLDRTEGVDYFDYDTNFSPFVTEE